MPMLEAPQKGTLYQVTTYVQLALKCFITGKYFLISEEALSKSTGSVDSLYEILHVEPQNEVLTSDQKGARTIRVPIVGNGSDVYEPTGLENDISPFVFT